MRRLATAAAVCAAALPVLPAQSSGARQSDFSIELAPARPAARATLRLHIVYRDPSDPAGKPSPIRHLEIRVPNGTKLAVGSVPRCQASDEEIKSGGPSACPAASRIGAGSLTAITGFGAPVDPFGAAVTVFNDGHGWIEVAQDRQSGATVAVDRIEIHGGALTGNPPATPGGPPDGQTAVRTIDLTLPASRRFVETPPTCPPGGAWRSTAAFTFADGSTQHLAHSAHCHSAPPRMSLTASPSRVRTGWRRIRFVVRSRATRCRRRATVHFAGRHAHTNANGHAAIRGHITHRGTYRPSVTKRGCRRARATILTRRRR